MQGATAQEHDESNRHPFQLQYLEGQTSLSFGDGNDPARGTPLGEELGFEGLTVEGVAARAGVGKTTIYRRWPNVWALVMDAFMVEVTRLAPIQKEGATTRQTVTESMRLLARAYRGRFGRMLRPLLGRAQVEPALMEAVLTQWIEPRRQIACEVLRGGIRSGELRADLDLDTVLDSLYGPLYHRLLLPYHNAPLSDAYIDKLTDTVFCGLERKPKRVSGAKKC